MEKTLCVVDHENSKLDVKDACSVRNHLVCRSFGMQQVFRSVQAIASCGLPVLVTGETGVGKGVAARAIHDLGFGAKRPFVCVNCGSIPQHLVESTFFGHERGAFTGADRRVKGLFEAAQGGTLFMDEIGELDLSAQAALLRVLDAQCFYRVGANRETHVDVRIVASTNRDLTTMCEEGRFRKDLYYRLAAETIQVPALRERPDDILPLAKEFVTQAIRCSGRGFCGLDDGASQALLRYDWPGNVRQLRHAVERAVAVSRDQNIRLHHLPGFLVQTTAVLPLRDRDAAGMSFCRPTMDLRSRIQRFEIGIIREALDKTGWNRSACAGLLGIPVRTLSRKMQMYQIDNELNGDE